MLPLVVFLLTRWYVASELSRPYTDLRLYFLYAVQGVDLGYTPYREIMIEYPPLAYWIIAAPRLARNHSIAEVDPGSASNAPVVSTRTGLLSDQVSPAPQRDGERLLEARHLAPEYARYQRIYRSALMFVDWTLLLLLMWLLRARGAASSHVALSALAYAGSTFFLGHVLWDRLDLWVALLAVGSLWCWQLTERSRHSWPVYLSLALCGLGAALKVFTLVMAPFLLLAVLRRAGPARALAAGGAFVAAAAGPFLVQVAYSGGHVLSFLQYHGERPIQIESVWASVQAALSLFGLDISVAHSHGSTNLDSPIASALVVVATAALLAVLLGLGLWALLRLRTVQQAYHFAAVALLATIALAKVLSVQFFLIALPVLLLLAPECRSPRLRWAIWALVPVLGLSSGAIFPYLWTINASQYPALAPYALDPHLHWLPLTILAARNLIFCGLTAAVGWHLLAGRETHPTPRESRAGRSA